MRPIPFAEQTVVVAEDQAQYQPLPAHLFFDASMRLACCWRLTWRERLKLLFTGRIWHEVMTYGHPLQPQKLSADKPAGMVPRAVVELVPDAPSPEALAKMN